MIALAALLAIAAQAATAQMPTDVPPPCSHLFQVYFDTSSHRVSERGAAILDIFAVPYVNWGLTSRVRLFAHTDTAGSTSENRRLAQRRGEAVRAYLVRKGIRSSRIDIVAEGETHLVIPTPDETPNEHNRVVFVVEQVTDAEMRRRRTAWAAFPNVVC